MFPKFVYLAMMMMLTNFKNFKYVYADSSSRYELFDQSSIMLVMVSWILNRRNVRRGYNLDIQYVELRISVWSVEVLT